MKKQKEAFVPIHLYIEDYYESQRSQIKEKKDDDEDRGIFIIEILQEEPNLLDTFR